MFPENRNLEPTKAAPRRAALGVLLGAIVLLFVIVLSQVSFNLSFLHPESAQQTEVFAGLSALIFLLFLALSFVLLRNLLKLYLDRQGGVLGAKFRSRMVVGALVISFVPVFFLYLFAYALLNRSIERWFSRPAAEVRQDASHVAQLLRNYVAANAEAEATTLAALPETKDAFRTGDFSGLEAEFLRHKRLQKGFLLASSKGAIAARFQAPRNSGWLEARLGSAGQPNQNPQFVNLEGKEYAFAISTAEKGGRLLVALPLPGDFSTIISQIEANQKRYEELNLQRRAVRRFYMQLLLLLTVLVLFVATWLSLFLSKLVTRPVAALAEATQEISRGRLDYRVEVAASDELGELVTSFNQMAAELEASRSQIEASTRELGSANVALEQRRRQIETILESIPTGVLSLDAARRVTHTNAAFTRLFLPPGRPAAGGTLRDLFDSEPAADLEHLLRKSDRMGAVTSQMEFAVQQRKLTVAVTVASLDPRYSGVGSAIGFPGTIAKRQRLGYVIVFEDFSDLLKAQKQTAWREVAQRVAHEIKNPLTPIALSAERIRRHLRSIPDEASLEVINGCAEAIAGAVETVRTLVDEFSALARFPASEPRPENINSIIENALALFNGRLDHILVETHLAPDLPDVMADSEAMKRVVANLVDNAAEAMEESLVREIHISTTLLELQDAVEIAVTDTGHGVTTETKERLFLPYFSTKKRGTGLGLAIVGRIIEDHRGSIRVEENYPMGSRFVMEIPIAQLVEAQRS